MTFSSMSASRQSFEQSHEPDHVHNSRVHEVPSEGKSQHLSLSLVGSLMTFRLTSEADSATRLASFRAAHRLVMGQSEARLEINLLVDVLGAAQVLDALQLQLLNNTHLSHHVHLVPGKTFIRHIPRKVF